MTTSTSSLVTAQWFAPLWSKSGIILVLGKNIKNFDLLPKEKALP